MKPTCFTDLVKPTKVGCHALAHGLDQKRIFFFFFSSSPKKQSSPPNFDARAQFAASKCTRVD
jgi:hypothetical protein